MTIHRRFVKDAQRGFTIVELMIVVVVIAILAAITIVAYNGIQKRA
ncbi:prepilin-type N-terminal cleavage/methylation domain-containing protein [Microbacterium oxydans]|nr:prepilin-type N-terminal cleavage/methylation domain-containing protein [Microbacterium oxydans]